MGTRRNREAFYPDTDTFKYSNLNPKNRITGDCVVRALSACTDTPYTDTVRELAEIQCETGWSSNSDNATHAFFKKRGWLKQKTPRKDGNKKVMGHEFCLWLTKWFPHGELGNVFLGLGPHHVACAKFCVGDDGEGRYKVHDIWYSTNCYVGVWYSQWSPEEKCPFKRAVIRTEKHEIR